MKFTDTEEAVVHTARFSYSTGGEFYGLWASEHGDFLIQSAVVTYEEDSGSLAIDMLCAGTYWNDIAGGFSVAIYDIYNPDYPQWVQDILADSDERWKKIS